MVLNPPTMSPIPWASAQPAGQAAGQEKLHLVALAVIEAQRLHLIVPSLRPIERGRRVDPAGEKDKGFFALAHDELDDREETGFFQGARFTWPALFAILH